MEIQYIPYNFRHLCFLCYTEVKKRHVVFQSVVLQHSYGAIFLVTPSLPCITVRSLSNSMQFSVPLFLALYKSKNMTYYSYGLPHMYGTLSYYTFLLCISMWRSSKWHTISRTSVSHVIQKRTKDSMYYTRWFSELSWSRVSCYIFLAVPEFSPELREATKEVLECEVSCHLRLLLPWIVLTYSTTYWIIIRPPAAIHLPPEGRPPHRGSRWFGGDTARRWRWRWRWGWRRRGRRKRRRNRGGGPQGILQPHFFLS